LILGSILGAVLFVRGFMISHDVMVNISAAISLLVIVIFANVVGAMLPFLGKLMRIDPAVMAGPLITTVADLAGIWIYFAVATRMLGIK